jgi:hypothetical protein
MIWKTYQVVLRLRSPMHIGWGKVGNVQRTRSYLAGRNFWGALTERLTRDRANGQGPATDSTKYQEVGREIDQFLAYTYLYPALRKGEDYAVAWPWQEDFSSRFLSSYASTALSYPQQAADEGTLHEVEFLSPNTLDQGAPVYLVGHIFEKAGAPDWRSALRRLQIGGERGYGWGRVELVGDPNHIESGELFSGVAKFEELDGKPTLCLRASDDAPGYLLAHANTTGLRAKGNVEPVVGREWRSNQVHNRYAGQHVEYTDVCFTPGSQVEEETKFQVGQFGIWRVV